MGTKSTLNAKNLRDQLKRILNYIRDNLRFVETDLSVGGDVELSKTLNVKPGGNSVFAVSESQVVINEPGNDVDFRVESDSATHMLFVDGGNNRVSVGTSVDAPAAVFEVQSPAASSVDAMRIVNEATGQYALAINASNTEEDVISVTADAVTNADVLYLSANALTTGHIANFSSASSSTSGRALVRILNDNTAATATTLLHLKNDATSPSVADVVIESIDPGAAAGPTLEFRRNSASPADEDVLGKILFNGEDDAGNTTLYASIRAEINDQTDSGGEEDGVIIFDIIKNNSQKSALELKNNEAVFNNSSQNIDFRVESDATTHALFVDAGEDHVRIDAAQGLHLKDLGTHASTPASGFGVIYVNGDVPYFKTDGGTATSMIAGGSGGAVSAVANGADNRVATFSSSDALNGEANLTFDGTDLGVSAKIFHVGDTDTFINFTDDDINIQAGGSNMMDFTQEDSGQDEITFNEAGTDIDFRVESNDETHMFFMEASTNRISIGDSTDSPAATLEITNHASAGATGVPLVQLNSNDTDKIALDINAANIDAAVIDITADAITTSSVLNISADGLTTGNVINAVSDSSDTSTRTAFLFTNENSSSSSTTALGVVQKAIQTCIAVANDNTETDFGPIFNISRNSTTVADDMGSGLINFQGKMDDGATTGYARVSAEASDVTAATPRGKLILRAQLSIDSSEPNAIEELMSLGGGTGASGAGASVVINDLSYDIDFRVESNDETHMLFVDGGNNRVSIGDSTDAPAATLEITNHASAGATGVPLVQLNNNDVDKQALDINAANTTEDIVEIDASALTTGKGIVLYSNSSSGSERDLMRIRNDNTGADATTLLRLMNDADPDDTPEGATMVIEHTFNSNNRNNLALTSTSSTGTTCAALSLQKSTTSEADDGFLGIIRFQGMNSNNDLHEYASIVGITSDVTNGDEGGLIKFFVHAGGTAGTADFKDLFHIGGEDVANSTVPEVVVNEAGINCDFRVEGDTETHLIFADGSVDRVSIGASTDAPIATLEISNASDAGVPLVSLDSNDTDEKALQIAAANIDANVFEIQADALTTANVIDVTADGLTTGAILNLVSDSSDTTARSLVNIINDNSAATAVTCLTVRNDSNMAATTPTVLIHDFGDMAADTHATLELRYEGSSGGRQAMLEFNQATGNSTDNDDIGLITATALNTADEKTTYCQIAFDACDRTDGDEGGQMFFQVMAAGTAGTAGLATPLMIGGENVANAVVPIVLINGDGINCDFRVESEGEDEAIFLDASANTLHINKGETAFETHIYNTNDVAMSVTSAGVVFNEDGHATNDFRVESDNIISAIGVDAGKDTVMLGGYDNSNHAAGVAIFNDFHGTTFENQMTDGQFGSAEILRYSPGADDTLGAGKLFFLHTDGTWDATDADAVATGATQMLGVGLGGSARTVGCLIKGFIRIPSTEILNLPGSGACDGLPLYVSTTAGHFDFTPPQGNEDFVRIVGYAIDDDSSDVLIYFNPDATHVEITA